MMLVVEAMRKRVDANLTSIRATEKLIRTLLKEPVSDRRTKQLEEYFAKNRKLLEENKIALAIQLNILDYIRFYGEILENSVHTGDENESSSNSGSSSITSSNSPTNTSSTSDNDTEDSSSSYLGDDSDEDDFLDEDDSFDDDGYDSNIFFTNVINGKTVYDELHLLWDDDDFYNKLLTYYIQDENYEACAKLKEARKNKE